MSDDTDLLVAKMDRSARSVSRLSTATKAVCGLMLLIALALMLYAFSRIDRRGGEDFVVFGLMSIITTALALVFWSTAAFHSAFAQSTQVLAALHLNADLLVRLQQRTTKSAPKGAHAEPAKGEARAATEPPPKPRAPEAAPPPVAVSAFAIEPLAPLDSPAPAPAAEAVVTPAAAVEEPPAAAPEPEVPQKICRNCKESIRAEALRCKYCFERV